MKNLLLLLLFAAVEKCSSLAHPHFIKITHLFPHHPVSQSEANALLNIIKFS